MAASAECPWSGCGAGGGRAPGAGGRSLCLAPISAEVGTVPTTIFPRSAAQSGLDERKAPSSDATARSTGPPGPRPQAMVPGLPARDRTGRRCAFPIAGQRGSELLGVGLIRVGTRSSSSRVVAPAESVAAHARLCTGGTRRLRSPRNRPHTARFVAPGAKSGRDREPRPSAAELVLRVQDPGRPGAPDVVRVLWAQILHRRHARGRLRGPRRVPNAVRRAPSTGARRQPATTRALVTGVSTSVL